MTGKQTIFHSDSRKPFPEEKPVVDAAQRAANDVANKYGKAAGAALFKGTAHVTTNPTVQSAVELMRQGRVTVAATRRDSHADTTVSQVYAGGMPKPGRRSAILDANSEAAGVLKKLGLIPK